MLQFTAAGENNQVQLLRFPFRYISAPTDALAPDVDIDFVQHRHGLSRQREQGRTVNPLACRHERTQGFLRVGRSDDIERSDQSQGADVVYRLTGGPIFADTAWVVGEHGDGWRFGRS